MSLSSNGNIVAVGAIFNVGNGSSSGHVRVYQNISGTWTQVSADIDGEAANDFSGWSVSLSSDGSIIAIGAIFNDGNGADSGHVRVYRNPILSSSGFEIEGLKITYSNQQFVSNLENVSLTVYTILGQTISNNNLKQGVYIVKAQRQNGNIQTFKFLAH